ncbi:hypothetical protein PMAYCL1PPCAC_30882 [Pristionchus mayeri]|uniref:Uncharacterized protein n=1 Tax=Pristionchus mayeri TaxID=1317129 RepID=A0AAN5IC28_9BILA|nr:hypothetical protein PMAYCL1PPCAC_30882 [Pristionchus mayeri]
MPPMMPMMPIIPQRVGNGMGGYVTSGRTANGVNYASASSYSSSSSGGGGTPYRPTTTTYTTGSLPYRPSSPSNTVRQESEKRTKLPNGGELITKTMVEKTPNGQRVSSFSYSQNPLGPVIPAAARNIPGSGKLPFSAVTYRLVDQTEITTTQKERLEQYKPPLAGIESDGDIYVREGSGEGPSPLEAPQTITFQSASSSSPGVTYTSSSSSPGYSFQSSSSSSQPVYASASQSSNAI